LELTAYCFVPLSAETHGRLGKAFMTLISDLGNLAVGRGEGTFTKGHFLPGVLREISVTLCRVNASLDQGVSGHCRTHHTTNVEDAE
jgi:hypothetical protein